MRISDWSSDVCSSDLWTATWTKDDWRASVYGYRWGSLPNWEETGRIAPYIIWNANVQKKITDNATVGLFVNNVLDKLHPEDDSFNSYPFFRSEEHTSELQSLMRISYAVFCLKKKI